MVLLLFCAPLGPNKIWAPDLAQTLTNYVLPLSWSLSCHACKMGTSLLLLQVAHIPEPVSQGIQLGLLKPTEFQGVPFRALGVVRLLLLRRLLPSRRGGEMPCLAES